VHLDRVHGIRESQAAGAATPTSELANYTIGGGWTSQNQYPRQLADVNGDGMADIVGFGADGVAASRLIAGLCDVDGNRSRCCAP
jgi:hypothetical protein